MTKNELKMKLGAGAFLVDLFDLTYGQECLIYKGNFEISDQIIYIPDVDLNEIDTETSYILDLTTRENYEIANEYLKETCFEDFVPIPDS